MSKKVGQRLRRPCKRCNHYFVPNSKASWICRKCKEKNHKKLVKRNRLLNKKNKLLRKKNARK